MYVSCIVFFTCRYTSRVRVVDVALLGSLCPNLLNISLSNSGRNLIIIIKKYNFIIYYFFYCVVIKIFRLIWKLFAAFSCPFQDATWSRGHFPSSSHPHLEWRYLPSRPAGNRTTRTYTKIVVNWWIVLQAAWKDVLRNAHLEQISLHNIRQALPYSAYCTIKK